MLVLVSMINKFYFFVCVWFLWDFEIDFKRGSKDILIEKDYKMLFFIEIFRLYSG